MGQVYLAQDTLLDRPVAIKFIANLDLGQVSAVELRERFFIEARAVARLQHPNVVLIYRVGEWQKHPYLVSEFVRGQSLDRVKKPLPWHLVHSIAIGLSRGLAAAHRRGVLHRDIKPANTVLTPTGDVKLLDFGLAKLVDITQVMSGPNAPLVGAVPPEVGPLRDTQLDLLVPAELEPGELAPALPEAPQEGGGNELADTLPMGKSPGGSSASSENIEPPPAAVISTAPAAAPASPAAPPAPAVLAAPMAKEAAPGAPGGPEAVAFEATILPATRSRRGLTFSSGGLTHLGDVIGSPLYMAPEIWRGEPATRQADIYSLGTLLYELCAGRAPHDGLSLVDLPLRVQERDPKPLAEAAPEADPRFCAIVDRCLRRSPAARYESGDALRAALEQLGAAKVAAVVPEGNPYRGLQSFEKQHRGLFFGRTAEVGAIIDRLRAESLVLVAGNSGVGKSSLCKAGVLAQLETGALGPLQVAPWQPGRRPLQALTVALCAVLKADESVVRQQLEKDPQELGRQICQRNHLTPSPTRVLLFIDQMEELITQSNSGEAAQVGEALVALLAYSPDIRVLGTVRADFLSRLLALPGIGAEVSRSLHLVGPLSSDGLREAITQPALALGYAFESAALVESLVNAAGQSDGGLPLLQFTLAALWEARDLERRIIPAAALAALGGVGGALARHADQIYARLLPRQQLAARRIFGQLITVEGTRTSKRRHELLGTASDLDDALALEALVAGRLLSVRTDESGEGSVYELAHEALLTGWGTLRSWLSEDIKLRELRQRLALSASEWERLGWGRELLWQRRQLLEAATISDAEAESMLAPREAAFLRKSRQAARRRWLGWAALIGGAPLLLGLLYLVGTLRAHQALTEKILEYNAQARSELSAARDLKQHMEALRHAAWQLYDARKWSEGEKEWVKALALEKDTHERYRNAERAAEAAFLLDTRRKQQRRLLAEIQYERGLLDERGIRRPKHDDLYQRLQIYDLDGTFQRRWDAPAVVDLDSEPHGAVVTLTPIDGHYQLRRESERSLGRTPLHGLTMAPGGYLLTLTAPGRVEVKYPFYVQRSESLPLHVTLPTSETVPPGFAYIPAGRFLFGSSATDDERRDFLVHVPLHEAFTDSFLIAQHETTYAEWLAYLRALPKEERDQRLPHTSQSALAGWLELKMLPDGKFELAMQPTERIYRAKEGERIVYPGRTLRREQDWLRMPVTGISSEDALAYVDWLRSSGRLPGARLCTEQEWERAARGADDRAFPHGEVLQPDDANYDRTYGQDPLGMGPDEVGSHPSSRSLFGVDDLLGNAFEWVSNSVSQKQFTLRGGAYYFGIRTNRLDNREESEPTLRSSTVGMRVCATIDGIARSDANSRAK